MGIEAVDPVAVLTAFQDRFGARIHEGYGLAETSLVAAFNQLGRTSRPGTIGTALWGVDVKIADPSYPQEIRLLPTGQLGELVRHGA